MPKATITSLSIYNTLTHEKELFPFTKKPIRLFVCGPTVYDYIHLGNARTYSFFDILVRYLRFSGFKVIYLQNITDIDDKIIRRATEKGILPGIFAKEFEKEFLEDVAKLGITSVNRYARATDHIPEIVRQAEALIKKNHAYLIPDDGYYFDITTFPNYGKLARRTAEQAEDGVSRIDENSKKKNRGDFCIWKFPKTPLSAEIQEELRKKKFSIVDGEPLWNTSLGWGRPGWHIEDTAITEHFFGPQYDIHGAAVDLIFPHHEAEIAQEESASGKSPMVKLWMHSAFFDMKQQKMSKSLGNFITARDFLKTHSANVFRFIVASHHYRTRIEYDEALATQAMQALATFEECLLKLRFFVPKAKWRSASPLALDFLSYEQAFRAAMNDDINTPKALATLFAFVGEINTALPRLSKSQIKKALKFLTEWLLVLGIKFEAHDIPDAIIRLAEKRENLRKAHQFEAADEVRNEMKQRGYEVNDTAYGPFITHTTSK